MQITILGKRWKVRFCRLLSVSGDCSSPSDKDKEIRIDNRLNGEHKLEILIHEFRHAADWGRDEGFVDQEAKDLARMLWRLGYRQKEDEV